MKPVDRLARYVTDTSFNDIPEKVIKRAKFLIMDSIGCALGATKTDLGKTYLRLGKRLGGEPESRLAGDKEKVSVENAALVNTQLANLLDFDDMYDNYPPFHPGCGIIQTALAAGEKNSATGKQFLTAVVVGYEVCLRVGRAMGHAMWTGGTPNLAAPIGPATVAAKLLDLKGGGVKRTLEIVEVAGGSLTTGTPKRRKYDIELDRTGSVKSNFGIAAHQGITSAEQAALGLDGGKGLLGSNLKEWYLAGLNSENYDQLDKDLGGSYRILDVKFKPTPSCHLTHLPITAAWKALEGETIEEDEVEELVVKGVKRLAHFSWSNMLEAQLSIPCTLALAVKGVPPDEWYRNERFLETDIKQLADKVRFVNDPEIEEAEIEDGKMSCEVEIVLNDGKTRSARVDQDHLKGAKKNPMSEDGLREKFSKNAVGSISGTVNQLERSLMGIESADNIRELTELLG